MAPVEPETGAGEQGFTLVELLVVLSLLSLLSLVTFASLRLGAGVSHRVEGRAQEVEDIGAAQSFLREAFSQAYPAVVALEPPAWRVSFQGEPEAVEFTASLPRSALSGELRRIAIYLVQNGTTRRLVLKSNVERNGRLSVRGADQEPSVILNRITNLRLQYFGALSTGAAPSWHDRWQNQKTMPKLIRLELDRGEESVSWPPMTVALRIDVDANCVLDRLTGGCRGR